VKKFEGAKVRVRRWRNFEIVIVLWFLIKVARRAPGRWFGLGSLQPETPAPVGGFQSTNLGGRRHWL